MGLFGYNLLLLKLIVTETENWKYCNKIIFKYVNSAMEPIFNKKIIKNWSLWVPYTVYETHKTDKRALKS